jgi:hypothetical protein
MLGRNVESKGGEVTGEWRKQHNEELHDLYSQTIGRVINTEKNEMGGSCSAYGGGERHVLGG